MFDRQNGRFGSWSESLSIFPGSTLHHPKAFRNLILSKWIFIFSKLLAIISIKLDCFFKLFWNQSLETFWQLFGWTSVGPSKCPIDKIMGSQGHRNFWAVSRVPSAPAKNSFPQKTFSKWKNVQSKHCRKFHCPLSKIGLHYQTVIYHRLTVFH